MTDSNFQKKRFITPERAAIILPTLIASFFVFIIISAFVIPKYVKSNKVNSEYKEFLRKKAELPQLKLQYKIINEKLKKLNDRKTKIINLVSGGSDLETFLERLGDLGFKNNIKILSINPETLLIIFHWKVKLMNQVIQLLMKLIKIKILIRFYPKE